MIIIIIILLRVQLLDVLDVHAEDAPEAGGEGVVHADAGVLALSNYNICSLSI